MSWSTLKQQSIETSFCMLAHTYLSTFFPHSIISTSFCYISAHVFSSNYCHIYFEPAKASLLRFVKQSKQLFGKQCLTYNFHVLSHLPHFVSLYGSIDSFSCFPFENYLYVLKKRLKSSRNLFHHSVNTLIDIRHLYTKNIPSSLSFSTATPNNCAILEGSKLILIFDLHDNQFVSGHQMMLKSVLYTYPYKSSSLMIGVYTKTTIVISGLPVNKCLVFPHNCDFIIIPLVNNELFVK